MYDCVILESHNRDYIDLNVIIDPTRKIGPFLFILIIIHLNKIIFTYF